MWWICLIAFAGAAGFTSQVALNAPVEYTSPRDHLLTELERADVAVLHAITEGPPEEFAQTTIDVSRLKSPVPISGDIERWIGVFTGPLQGSFTRWLEELHGRTPQIASVLEREQLPAFLKYLALVESGLNPLATSTSGAAGIWQIMPPTAHQLDLRVDWWIDERRDPFFSTYGAARLLKELHYRYSDWSIAMAAYNGGPVHIDQALEKSGESDFSSLQRWLRPEPRHFVAKVYAAMIIAENPDVFDLKLASASRTSETVRKFAPNAFGIPQLTTCANMDSLRFMRANPAIGPWGTPADGYSVRIPKGAAATFVTCLQQLPEPDRAPYRRHRVTPRDSIASVADVLRCPVADVVRLNSLSPQTPLHVGQIVACYEVER